MRSITLSFYAQFFVLGIVYYGLSFGADKLGVDPFVYMAVSGVMEVPSSTLTIPLVEKMGRRASSTLFFVVTAGSLLVLGSIPDALEWLVVTMAMLGRLAITAASQIVVLYVSELFPTEVRVRGIGTCTMVSEIGAMLAPFILESLGSIKPWVPLVMFGVAAFVASVITFWLPESRGAPMLDTVASLEAAYGAAEDASYQKYQSTVPATKNLKFLAATITPDKFFHTLTSNINCFDGDAKHSNWHQGL
ncbi:solute carrier family 22 member 3-like [Penaeus vannamei]|uniref:solute carrier family 22 member 3-like n=1 Tax=Penaeus vannamei TaxID=6689 RepID=UPI00387F5C0A